MTTRGARGPAVASTSEGGPASATGGVGNNTATAKVGQEKENMTEFIAKKREMFLVQMSLDTKREEILCCQKIMMNSGFGLNYY